MVLNLREAALPVTEPPQHFPNTTTHTNWSIYNQAMDDTATELSDWTVRRSDPDWVGSTDGQLEGSHTRSDGHMQSSSFDRGHNRSGSVKQSTSNIAIPALVSLSAA